MAETHGNASDPLEPKTPMWLTVVGAVLFLTVGLIWGLTPSSQAPGAAQPASSASGAAAGGPAAH